MNRVVACVPGHSRLLAPDPACIGQCATPARDFGAYSVTFDSRALGVGETADAGPGVRLIRGG